MKPVLNSASPLNMPSQWSLSQCCLILQTWSFPGGKTFTDPCSKQRAALSQSFNSSPKVYSKARDLIG